MEDYSSNQMGENATNNDNSNSNNRSHFAYSSIYGSSSSPTAADHHHRNQFPVNSFQLQSNHHGDCSGSQHQQSAAGGGAVKTEGSPHQVVPKFHQYPLLRGHPITSTHQQQQFVGGGGSSGSNSHEVEAMKAKIIAHPQYSNLLQAYMDCQKIGAPPEVVARLAAVRQEFDTKQRCSVNTSKDPELDQFMEAYYDMLVKYREELSRPVQEAMEFMKRIESQLNLLTNGRVRVFNPDEKSEGAGSSEEEHEENSGGETELAEIDPRAEDRELKNHLLKKYSGYLSSLKQELSKKKKKGKLPKEARQKLLAWWELHYKWPYPSESEKVALAEATGLDQKQINNWFINQRKRHWKPSEDMQFMVMDGMHPQNAALYMDGHYMGDGPYRFGT